MEEDSSCFDAPLCCGVLTRLHRSLLPELESQLNALSVSHGFITKETTEISTSLGTQATNDFTIHCPFRELHSRRDTRTCFYSCREVQPIHTLWGRSKKCSQNEESPRAQTALYHKRAGSESQRARSWIHIRRNRSVPLLQWYMRSRCTQLRPLPSEHPRQKEDKKRESKSQTLLQASSIWWWYFFFGRQKSLPHHQRGISEGLWLCLTGVKDKTKNCPLERIYVLQTIGQRRSPFPISTSLNCIHGDMTLLKKTVVCKRLKEFDKIEDLEVLRHLQERPSIKYRSNETR